MKYNPIIIIGAARSGTNMLRDILTDIPNYGTWDCDEINPIWRHGNLNHPHDEFYPQMASSSVIKFVQKEFEKIAKSQKVDNVVEKSCANSLRVSFINEIFPEAKYVFIYRDGRDTVASAAIRWNAKFELNYTLKKLRYTPLIDIPYYGFQFGRNRLKQFITRKKQLSFWGVQIKNMQDYLKKYSLYEVCALQWKECVDKSLKDFETINPEQVIKVRYEDFVTNPEKELKLILDFLKVDSSNLDIPDIVKNISMKSIGKHKQQLSEEDQAKINLLLKDTLTKLNYIQ